MGANKHNDGHKKGYYLGFMMTQHDSSEMTIAFLARHSSK